METSGSAGWVTPLMVAVLLNWCEAARSCHEIQPVTNLLHRGCLQSKFWVQLIREMQNWNPSLFSAWYTTQWICFVLWSAVFAVLGEWRMRERLPRGDKLPKQLCREIFCQISSLCPDWMRGSLRLQTNQSAQLSKNEDLLPFIYRGTCLAGEDTRKVSWTHTELQARFPPSEFAHYWMWKSTRQLVNHKASTAELQHTSLPHACLHTSFCLVPQGRHW